MEIESNKVYVSKEHVEDIIQLSTYSAVNLDSYLQANIVMGTHLLEALKAGNAHESKSFINIGTNWQHYEQENYRAVNLYATTKEAFEKL